MKKMNTTNKTNTTKKTMMRHEVRPDLVREADMLLREKNVTRADGSSKRVSDATMAKRRQVLISGIRQLSKLGYHLAGLRSFAGRHIQALVDHWVEKRLSPSTLQNRISIFRTFAEWLGKPGMVLDSSHYVRDESLVRRSSVARQNKSWPSHEVDPQVLIESIRAEDAHVAMAMEFQLAFGLRVRESLMLRPYLADMGNLLSVNRGTKNGRHRLVEIDTDERRDVLVRAKALVQAEDESIAGSVSERNLKHAKNHYYTVVRKFGVTRKNGLVSHMLRHHAANEHFAQKAGYRSPVQGGPMPTDKARENFARIDTAEFLGHSRPDVTTHYLGRCHENPRDEPMEDRASAEAADSASMPTNSPPRGPNVKPRLPLPQSLAP